MEGAMRNAKSPTCLEHRQLGTMPCPHLKAYRKEFLEPQASQLDPKVLHDLGLPVLCLPRPLTCWAQLTPEAGCTDLQQYISGPQHLTRDAFSLLCLSADLLLDLSLDVTAFAKLSRPPYL